MSKRKVVTKMPVLTHEHTCLSAEDCTTKKCDPLHCGSWQPRVLQPELFELVLAWVQYRKLNVDESGYAWQPAFNRMDDAVMAVTSWDVRKL